MRNRDILNRIKWIVLLINFFLKIFGKKLNYIFFKGVKNFPGKTGILLRFVTIKNCTSYCGWNVCLKKGVIIKNPYQLSIGNNVSINENCFLDALGGIEIGNDVSIAHDVSIISFEHVYDNLNIPIKDQGLKSKKIKINDNVWVAAKAVLLAGTVINS